MALDTYYKTSAERKRYALDYVDWLDSGEEVSSVVFAVTPAGELEVDAYEISGDGTQVMFFVNAGVAGAEYTVNAKATTSGGQIKEDEVVFIVQEL